MIHQLPTITRYTGFGFNWTPFPEVSVFTGISKLEIVEGGCLKAYWTDVAPEYYNVYVRADDSNIFSNSYLLGTFPTGLSSLKIRTLADGVTLLNHTQMVYVGVRALGPLGEDTNTKILNVRPLGWPAVFVDKSHVSLVF